jgi:hypothetical protein
MSDKRKRWVFSLESDPILPPGVNIGYYQGPKFYCNCGSVISERGINIHFETQKHHHWTECQSKLIRCGGGSCGTRLVMSPRKRPASPTHKKSPPKLQR